MRHISLVVLIASLSFSVLSQDRQEGWVIQETEAGLIKVPKKQYFSFSGMDINGEAYTPSQGIFEKRRSRKRRNLIPVRKSFQREALDASGYIK